MTELSPLLPNRYPETDMFFCDIGDAVVKDDMASMEHPIFALTKQPCMTPRRYEHGENWLEVVPSEKGIANIYDKDILIFAISQIMAAKNAGRPYSKDVSFVAHDFLKFSNRNTGGKDYEALKDALSRLDGTRLRTNIKTGDQSQWRAFGLIDGATIRKETLDGRVLEWGISLSNWLFSAIESNEVLTINPDYFRLRKPLERKSYEIARKHCGNKKEWSISVELLQKKCGSTSPKKRFKQMLRTIEKHQHLPDYQVALIDDMVTFYRTGKVGSSDAVELKNNYLSSLPPTPQLRADTLEKAGEMCRAKGFDKYAVVHEWWEWAHDKEKPGKGYDAAFLGFVKMKISTY